MQFSTVLQFSMYVSFLSPIHSRKIGGQGAIEQTSLRLPPTFSFTKHWMGCCRTLPAGLPTHLLLLTTIHSPAARAIFSRHTSHAVQQKHDMSHICKFKCSSSHTGKSKKKHVRLILMIYVKFITQLAKNITIATWNQCKKIIDIFHILYFVLSLQNPIFTITAHFSQDWPHDKCSIATHIQWLL